MADCHALVSKFHATALVSKLPFEFELNGTDHTALMHAADLAFDLLSGVQLLAGAYTL